VSRPIRFFTTLLFLVVAYAASAAPDANTAATQSTTTPSKAAPSKTPSKKATPVAVPSDQIGIVDGIPIYQSEWDRLAKPYFAEVEKEAGRPLTDDERTLMQKNVLNELIRERLWVADARRRGMKIPDTAIDSRMKQSDFFKTNGQAGESKFLAFKNSPASNYATLHQQYERELLMEEYTRWMEKRFGPREAELKKAFEERTAQASIRYFVLGPDVISLEPEASAAQIRAYYDDHADEFVTPDEAHIQYIKVGGSAESAPGDSVRETASESAGKTASEVLSAIKAGAPEETAAKPHGGLMDTGWFRIGDPMRGLGKSDALASAIRTTEPGQWIREPIRIGSYAVVAKVVERRKPRRVTFTEAVPQAKRKADMALHETLTDSLARAEVRLHPENFRAPKIRASVIARGLSSFEAGSPPSSKDVDRRVNQIRKDQKIENATRAWQDSMRAVVSKTMIEERRVGSAMRVMRDAAIHLRKGEDASRVALRAGASRREFQLYHGEPPTSPLIVEGATLDSLFELRAGDVLGPRVRQDSVYVVRVETSDPNFLPPYEVIRPDAHAAVQDRRTAEWAKEGEAYFRDHRDNYLTPPRWVVDYVVFRKARPESVQVSPDSIDAYWREHPAEFTVPASARVHHILIACKPNDAAARAAAQQKAITVRKRIVAGEDFAAVAREVSDDTESAQHGGDVGEITRGTVVKEFGDAAFSIPVGELSEPVRTQFGYHILRVDERSPERLRPVEDCRDEIQGVLGGDKADSLARNAAESFLAALKAGGSFDSLAAKVGQARRSEPTANGGDLRDAGKAYWLEKEIGSLEDGQFVAKTIPFPDGYIIAKRVRGIKPERAPFEDVRERAIQDAQRERRRSIADSLDARYREAVRGGADPESLFVAFGGLRPSKSFGKEGPIPDLSRDPGLGRDSTYLSRIFTSKPGTVLPPIKGNTGTLYGVVDAVSVLPPTEFAKQRDALLREIVEQRVDAWTERLRSKAPIKILKKDLAALQG